MIASKRSAMQANLIALTQTELMFVFATLIILILLNSIEKVDEYEKERQQIAEMLDDDRPQPERLAERTGALIDENRKLSRVLELAKQQQLGEGDRARLVENARKAAVHLQIDPDAPLPEIMEAAVQKLENREAERRLLADALARADRGPDGSGAQQQELRLVKRARALAARSNATQQELRQIVEHVQKSGIDQAQIKTIRQAAAQQQQDEDTGKFPQPSTLSDRLGFTPCWPKAALPHHHFAFAIEWNGADGYRLRQLFSASEPIIARALSGPLALLRDYPQGWISRERLLAFGQKIEQARSRQYKEDCRLTARIGDNANRDVVVFIRDRVHLYPIYR